MIHKLNNDNGLQGRETECQLVTEPKNIGGSVLRMTVLCLMEVLFSILNLELRGVVKHDTLKNILSKTLSTESLNSHDFLWMKP
jgi:hypothetical protein